MHNKKLDTDFGKLSSFLFQKSHQLTYASELGVEAVEKP
jgi:hypothetical protein